MTTYHAAGETAQANGAPRDRIVLDLSHDPKQEDKLVAVLSEMVRAAMARRGEMAEDGAGEPTPDPGPGSRGSGDDRDP